MMKTNNQAEEYTRLKEGGTLTKCETVFFANPQDFGFGTVEIRNFTQIRQKILR